MIWAVIFCVCLFLLGAILGAYVGWGWGERAALADLEGEAEADEYVELLEDPEARAIQRRYRQRRTSTAAFLNPPEVAHEAMWEYRTQNRALAGQVVRMPELVESDAAWEARVFGDLDRFMGGLLGAYPAPAGDSQ